MHFASSCNISQRFVTLSLASPFLVESYFSPFSCHVLFCVPVDGGRPWSFSQLCKWRISGGHPSHSAAVGSSLSNSFCLLLGIALPEISSMCSGSAFEHTCNTHTTFSDAYSTELNPRWCFLSGRGSYLASVVVDITHQYSFHFLTLSTVHVRPCNRP